MEAMKVLVVFIILAIIILGPLAINWWMKLSHKIKEMSKTKVLVYGFLRKGEPLHPVMEAIGAEFKKELDIKGIRKFLTKSRLYACEEDSKGTVLCEQYLIERRFLRLLDDVENVPELYYRKKIKDGYIYLASEKLLMDKHEEK